MQTRSIDINDSGRVIIGDRVYYPASGGSAGMLENPNTGEKAMLKKCDDPKKTDRIRTFEADILPEIRTKRGNENLIFPELFCSTTAEGEAWYSFSEIPPGLFEKTTHCLGKAYTQPGFSMQMRVMAAMNLTEILAELREYAGRKILSLHPEEIYINIENGEVYLRIEQWLDPAESSENVDEPGFSPEWYERENRNVDGADLDYFTSYAVFRLLCMDEPFDGSETLLMFPLLTKEAIRSIRRGKYGFALSAGDNYVSKYIGQELWKRWSALPGFLRNEFEKNFTAGIRQRDRRIRTEEWVFMMRRMRDCLVYVNGQFRFCDPDVPNKVLFMVFDQDKIPVWPNKAVYWYHAGIPEAETQGGIVAGVTFRNGNYYLNNLTGQTWGAQFRQASQWIGPQGNVELVEGLEIALGNGKTLRIINGQNPGNSAGGPVKTDDAEAGNSAEMTDAAGPEAVSKSQNSAEAIDMPKSQNSAEAADMPKSQNSAEAADMPKSQNSAEAVNMPGKYDTADHQIVQFVNDPDEKGEDLLS